VSSIEKIKYIVYTADLDVSVLLKDFDCEKIKVLDPRSAVYTATGIAAQNKEIVLVLMNSNNSSRSAFSGMTEAFYRNLPVVLITLGKNLDYRKELNDVVNSHFQIGNINDIYSLLDETKPMHIEVDYIAEGVSHKKCQILNILSDVLIEDDYLLVSNRFDSSALTFKCKMVRGGFDSCNDGMIANVLGASLAKKRRRYIGLISEEELSHDINTLGNVNINDLLVYIVCCEKENKLIKDYCESLGFEYGVFANNNIDKNAINGMIKNGRKTLIAITDL